jgi:glycosyltransferase involved in cell wall biosynthesis
MSTPHKPNIIFMRLMPPVIVWGGLEKLMLEWFERLDYTQCSATLIVQTGGGEIYTRYLKTKNLPVSVVEFPFRKNFQYTENFLGRLTKTLKLLNKLKPDQVVFFQGSFTDFDLSHVLPAHWTAKGNVYMHENLGAPEPSANSSKKYLGFIPGLGLWWLAERYLTPLRARFCKKVFVVSSEIKDRMVKLWHYPPGKVDVLYHGVDIQKFHPAITSRNAMRQQMGFTDSDLIIIAAARLSQEKCIDRAIEAFDQLSTKNQHIHLVIAGTGPYEKRLKELACTKSSANKIKFLGQVSNVNELYQMSDIYVLSSDNEGLSLAFLEALASGLVCVATKCTGTTEVIKDGINGFLVEKSLPGVFNGLQKAVNLGLKERNEIQRQAVEFVTQRFEINKNVREGLNVLNLPIKQS